jgi:prepilin-type N-terminal cleavage/methylation domain-containing protein
MLVRTTKGFTLIELVMVLIMMGALAIAAYPRLNVPGFRAVAFHQEVLDAVRYAKNLAANSGCDVQVVVEAATDSYALYYRNDAAATAAGCTGSAGFGTNPVAHPVGSGAYTGSAPVGVDVTNGLTVWFDSLGVPHAGGDSADIGGFTVTVEAETGYVHD